MTHQMFGDDKYEITDDILLNLTIVRKIQDRYTCNYRSIIAQWVHGDYFYNHDCDIYQTALAT